jgi:hypothetical protein
MKNTELELGEVGYEKIAKDMLCDQDQVMYSLDFRFSTTKMDLNYLSFYGHQEV